MSSFGPASGSIWENWLRDHRDWMNESRDAGEFIAKFLWTPIGAASTACAAYVDELERRPSGTLMKTAGVAFSLAIPGAGPLAVAADAAAVATGQVIGDAMNTHEDRYAADHQQRLSNQQTLAQQREARQELDSLFG
jgi:hypothetical protein